MRRTPALVALVTLFLALLPGVAGASPEALDDARGRPTFKPGAIGIGDPYYPTDGNGGYDVRHYDLDVTYDPVTDVLSGTATIRARATQNLSAFNLDLAGLNVRSVHVDGRPAEWTRGEDDLADELTVTPSRGLRDRTRFTVVITYDGIPETLPDVSGFFHTDDGALVIGQPHVADTWFPVNDHPIDKASYTIHITAPAGLEAISNGILQRTRERNGWVTWTWNADEPMASYLAMMAIGEFDLRAYRDSGIRYWDALDPDLFAEPAESGTTLGDIAEGSLARQPEIIAWQEDLFGRYPFSAAGGIVDDLDELGFALETQTRPIYAKGFFDDPVSGDLVVVHELAHQWFGDSLAVERWADIWLNEGFATYTEWLWLEREGLVTAQEMFDFIYGEIPADDEFWTLIVGDPGPELENLFHPAVYDRGAMTLHQLRLTIGDEDFFRLVRRWAQSYEGGNVSTEDFIALAERVSGEQLDELFDAWLFTGSKPDLVSAADDAAAAGTSPAGRADSAGQMLDRMQRARSAG
jgi:aminopeptidase N